MKPDLLEEPELEFGGLRRHVDIRQGLTLFGPLDSGEGSPRVDADRKLTSKAG
jgi:hypothetical protein